jgi:hypothetical protein
MALPLLNAVITDAANACPEGVDRSIAQLLGAPDAHGGVPTRVPLLTKLYGPLFVAISLIALPPDWFPALTALVKANATANVRA